MDKRLRKLYEKQLQESREYLSGLLKQPQFLGTDARRLAPALNEKNVESLVGVLEEILSVFAIYGVVRDFERLRKSNVLFVSDKDSPTKTVANTKTQVLDLDAAFGTGGAAPTFTANKSVTKEIAYQRYFGKYVAFDMVWQNNSPKTGVEAFYKRYPLLDHAVKTVTDHYKNNIKLACERVAKNWDDISGMFSDRTIDRLLKIQTTGNDFHKGGKQVLILTFGSSNGPDSRVVYKPFSVEIDCRIVGNSDFVNKIRLGGYQQLHSLTELINSHNPSRQQQGGYVSRPLPTYKFLPYDCANVRDAYGYIEFLTHNPTLKLENSLGGEAAIRDAISAQIGSLTAADVRGSDWITATPSDGQTYYHAFGGLMAMAMAVSLCDFHVQNMIAHDRLPHLIDLEEALKRPFTSVKDTLLNTVLDRFDDPGSPKLNVESDSTSDVLINKSHPTVSELAPAASVLYLHNGTGQPGRPLLISDDPKNRRALVQGFTEVIETLAIEECNDAVQQWVKGLGGVVARFVTRATKIYAASGRELYWQHCDAHPPATDKEYDTFESQKSFFFRGHVRSGRFGFNQNANKADATGWTAHPFFACEHPDHAWRDYFNCDVPSFYHKLGERDLLNSRGDPVQVAEVIKWQNTNISDRLDLNPKGWVTQYFPEKPIDMIVDQLEKLKDACESDQSKRTYLKTALEGIVLSRNKLDWLQLLVT